MEWKIFSMEWKKIASMEYEKIIFHSIPYHAQPIILLHNVRATFRFELETNISDFTFTYVAMLKCDATQAYRLLKLAKCLSSYERPSKVSKT